MKRDAVSIIDCAESGNITTLLSILVLIILSQGICTVSDAWLGAGTSPLFQSQPPLYLIWMARWAIGTSWQEPDPMVEQDDSRTPSISLGGLKEGTCCISIAVPLTHPYIPHMTLLIHQLCSDGLLWRRKIAATWGREGVKEQTVVKRLCRELSPALVRGTREEAQVEAQQDQAAKGWASLCSTPEASMKNSLFSTW